MLVPPTPPDESRRLAELDELQILDTPAEDLFDTFARLAATVCGVPISLISLVDADRQWFKANVGLDGVTETPRAISFCGHAILGRDVFEVPDAAGDARFADNPLVTGEPNIRFYAGAPLITPAGAAVGTLCVIDRVPRRLTDEQRAALRTVAATIADQFETRRARRLADRKIQLLSAALEATEDAVIITEASAGAHEPWAIVYANEAFLRQKGATEAQIVGATDALFHGPKTDPAVIAELREKLLRGEPVRVEYITYRLDGSHYYAEVAARPLSTTAGGMRRFVMIQHDVTESVLRGAQLAMQNERLTTLTSVARGIFAALEPTALVDSLIAGARELVGAEARLLAVRPNGGFAVTHDLTVPERAPLVGDAFIDAANRSDVTMLSEDENRAAIRIAGSLGQTRYIFDVRSERPLHTADIFALGLLGQYFAVAARNVELYGELQARSAAVVELNQIKNDLIAMLAHDFKGPLTTIVGFADVLAEDERFDDESRKFLTMISSSAMRLASLATDTLALSRLEQNELALDIEQFDVVALVREVVRVFSVTRPIDLRTDRPEFVIGGDPARLRQVFENLIGNAIKYSPGGEPVEVLLKAKARTVEVSVRDHGIGIPAADRSKLFGRFARAQNARALGIGGTGFGLYLSKTIVEMHGGVIAVDSKEGIGSTFKVTLSKTPAAQRAQQRRFILNDPEGDAKSYVAHTLRDEGSSVTVVADAAAMLAQIDETRFDAAICDIEKMGIDPAEFARKVAGRAGLIRIDPVTVAPSPAWDAALVKPFLMKDLRAAIEAALERQPRLKLNGEVAMPLSKAAGSA